MTARLAGGAGPAVPRGAVTPDGAQLRGVRLPCAQEGTVPSPPCGRKPQNNGRLDVSVWGSGTWGGAAAQAPRTPVCLSVAAQAGMARWAPGSACSSPTPPPKVKVGRLQRGQFLTSQFPRGPELMTLHCGLEEFGLGGLHSPRWPLPPPRSALCKLHVPPRLQPPPPRRRGTGPLSSRQTRL